MNEYKHSERKITTVYVKNGKIITEFGTVLETIIMHRILFSVTETARRYDNVHLKFKHSGGGGL
jgi:hypothetical protein